MILGYFIKNSSIAINSLGIDSVKYTAKRFTLASIFIAINTILILLMIHGLKHKEMLALTASIFYGTVMSISFTLFLETHKQTLEKYRGIRIFDIISIIFVSISYLLFMNAEYHISLMLIGFGLLLSILYAPYIFLKIDGDEFSKFFTEVNLSLFFTGITTLILCLGITAIIASIQYLFGIIALNALYFYVWIFGYVFFAPFYLLSLVPKNLRFLSSDEYEHPKFIKFVVNNMLSPLLIVYMFILYIYIIKIIIIWELPKGNLAYIVSWFGAKGTITYLLAYSIREQGNIWLQLVCKYFYHALIIPIILLAVGIWVRIDQYGITEPRYLVMLTTIWLSGSAGYMIISKSKKLEVIPIFLSLLLIIASIGPLSAFNVSAHSQVSRLEVYLKENNILVNNKIKKTEVEINFDEEKEIGSILWYLIKTNKDEYIKEWFLKTDHINIDDDLNVYAMEKTKNIMNDMGLTYIDYYRSVKQRPSSHVSTKGGYSHVAIPLEKYDYLINIGRQNIVSDKWLNEFHIPNTNSLKLDNDVVKIEIIDYITMIITSPKGDEVTFDLAELFSKEWTENIKMSDTNGNFSAEIEVKRANGRLTDKEYKLKFIDFILFVSY